MGKRRVRGLRVDGELLFQLRKKLDISQLALAHATMDSKHEVSHSVINRMERGIPCDRTSIDVVQEVLDRLCIERGLTPRDIRPWRSKQSTKQCSAVPQETLRHWDPRFPDRLSGCALFEEFSHYLYHSADQGTVFFHKVIPSPLLTPEVQRNLNSVLVAPIAVTNGAEAEIISRQLNSFQDARRQQFDTNGSHGPAVGMIFRHEFERLVQREPPYHHCTAEEVEEALLRIRTIQMDSHNAYEVIVLDESRFDSWLKTRLDGIDTLGLIGGGIVFQRHENFCVTGLIDTRGARSTLEALRKLTVQSLSKSTIEQMLKQLKSVGSRKRVSRSPGRARRKKH